MDTTNLLTKKVGTKEKPKLQAKTVKIASVIFQTKNKKDEVMSTPLAQVLCKHPDKEEILKITKIKFIDGEDIKTVAFWTELDEDGNFQKGSAIDALLKHLKCETLEEIYGKDIDTIMESESKQYLCLKAY